MSIVKNNALWQQAFRPFFLAASLFSISALCIWILYLNGYYHFSFAGNNPLFWHQHEMIFGFTSAIIVAFLLTAVQNWTGIRATHGKQLILLFLLWLSSRVLFIVAASIPLSALMLIDSGFLFLAAYFFFRILSQGQQKRNYFLALILLLLNLCNIQSFLAVSYGNDIWLRNATSAAVFLIVLIICVITGRVLPMFTANGTKTSRVEPIALLEKAILVLVASLFVIYFLGLVKYFPSSLLSILCGIIALLLSFRLLRLRPLITLKYPLLWSLHIACWMLALGFILLCLHHAKLNIISYSAAQHMMTAGTIGNLILAMMARISLGHTGRELTTKRLMSVAFISMILAGLTRSLAMVFIPNVYKYNLIVSMTFWALAYGIFILLYFEILISPRADGKEG